MEKEQMELEWMGCPESCEICGEDHYLQEIEELRNEQKKRFAEALIPETPNTDMLMINGARQEVVQALEGKGVEEDMHIYQQELIEALKAQSGADTDKAQQSFICIADTYASDAQKFEHAREQALAYAAGFWRGQGVADPGAAGQHLDSLEHSQEFEEKDDWVNQHAQGMIAGIKKRLSSPLVQRRADVAR